MLGQVGQAATHDWPSCHVPYPSHPSVRPSSLSQSRPGHPAHVRAGRLTPPHSPAACRLPVGCRLSPFRPVPRSSQSSAAPPSNLISCAVASRPL